jgi:hypothetical protein
MRPPLRLSYASVMTTLALVIALGTGTAIAAHHYLLTATSQIKPSVLRTLRGATGATGPTGAAGSRGKTGGAGQAGAVVSAWGRVSVSGALTTGYGVTAVTSPASGEYCITLANGQIPSNTVLVVSPDYTGDLTYANTANAGQAVVEYDSAPTTDCSPGQFLVLTGERTVTTNGSGDVTAVNLNYAADAFSFEAR